METTSDNPCRYPIFTADWVVITIYVALLAFGWLSICGASHEIGDVDFFSWGTRTGKQLVWIGLAFTLGFFLLMTDDRYFENLADIVYWGMMLVLLVTPFLAKDIKGSKSWISLGAVSLQNLPNASPPWPWPNSSTATAFRSTICATSSRPPRSSCFRWC